MHPKNNIPFNRIYSFNIDPTKLEEEGYQVYLNMVADILRHAFEDAGIQFDDVSKTEDVEDIMAALDMMDASVEGDEHPEALHMIMYAYKKYNGSN
jgi:hypothetical protein